MRTSGERIFEGTNELLSLWKCFEVFALDELEKRKFQKAEKAEDLLKSSNEFSAVPPADGEVNLERHLKFCGERELWRRQFSLYELEVLSKSTPSRAHLVGQLEIGRL